MSASLTIEEERGTYVRCGHPHNGYYAGDFSHRDNEARGRFTPPDPNRSPSGQNQHHVPRREPS
jgi:hypothetical protein